jgi:hypothetical protein
MQCTCYWLRGQSITTAHAPAGSIELIDSADTTDFQKMQMHNNITTFEGHPGWLRRLLQYLSPLPTPARTSRFLLIWLTALLLLHVLDHGLGHHPTSGHSPCRPAGEIGIEIEERLASC